MQKTTELNNCNDSAIQQTIRVLVADDDFMCREVVKEYLSLMNCHVSIAEDGAEALDMVKMGSYHLVLMDWQMPHLDGCEVTTAIRSLENKGALLGRMPIIGLSAHALPGHRETCLAVGMDDYVTKPVSYEKLESLVGQWAIHD